MISAKVELTQPLSQQRQFVAHTGSEHHLLLDDAAGGTGPKPIELVAVGLAGCTAFDVITILRQKYHQKITGYEVRVEADQAERPPQVFTAIRIHHVVKGFEIDAAAIEEAIRLSEVLLGGSDDAKDGEPPHHLWNRRGHDGVDEESATSQNRGLKRSLHETASTPIQ